MADPTLSALAAYSGQYEKKLMTRFLNGFDVNNPALELYPTVKNKLNLTQIVVNKGAKPYTGKHVAKDDIVYTPRILTVEDCQRDLTIDPKQYRPTFMAEMRGRGENANNMTIPFAQYVNEAIIKELNAEINNETLYHGVGKAAFTAFNGASTYSPGARITFTQDSELRYFKCVTATLAGESPSTHPAKWVWAGAEALTKGFGGIIADEITGGALNPVVTGTVTSSNAYASFIAMFRALPLAVRNQECVILCSYTDFDLLLDDYEDKVKKNFEESNGITYLAKTDRKCIIAPWSAMSGSRRLIATAKKNFVVGTDEFSDMNTIKTKEEMYHLDMGMTWVMGMQIRDLGAMRVSNQA
jgi:hypothetical protein